MITVSVTGSFNKTNKYLDKLKNISNIPNFDKYGKMGVEALSLATPRKTGVTAASWSYKITQNKDSVVIEWRNSNTTDTGIPIVVLLQYGHGTANGGYVQGIDFINPALKPVFEEILKDAWEEVKYL